MNDTDVGDEDIENAFWACLDRQDQELEQLAHDLSQKTDYRLLKAYMRSVARVRKRVGIAVTESYVEERKQ